jgi:hypothetical protein
MASSCPSFAACNKPTECWDGSERTANCWKIVWILLGVGAGLVMYGDFCLEREGMFEKMWKTVTRAFWTRLDPKKVKKRHELEKQQDERKHTFASTLRTESNFCRNNTDPLLVFPEYVPANYNSVFTAGGMFKNLRLIFYARYVHSICLSSLGWGCICSSLGTTLWLILSYDEYCFKQGFAEGQPNAIYIQGLGDAFSRIINDYKFLPIFLITGALGFLVDRWRRWLIIVQTTWKHVNDIAMLLGGAVPNPAPMDIRKKLFKVYRYANLCHALGYQNISPDLAALDLQSDFVEKLGLLTHEEAQRLAKTKGAIKNIAFTWLTNAVSDVLQRDGVNSNYVAVTLADQMKDFRTTFGGHGLMYRRQNPNIYENMLFLIVTFLLILIKLGYPFSLLVYTGADESLLLTGAPCFQPMVMFGVFIYSGAIRVIFMAMWIMRDPFTWTGELIEVDNILSNADLSIFAHIRATFYEETNDEFMKDCDSSVALIPGEDYQVAGTETELQEGSSGSSN